MIFRFGLSAHLILTLNSWDQKRLKDFLFNILRDSSLDL